MHLGSFTGNNVEFKITLVSQRLYDYLYYNYYIHFQGTVINNPLREIRISAEKNDIEVDVISFGRKGLFVTISFYG